MNDEQPSIDDVTKVLESIKDPESGRSIVRAEQLGKTELVDGVLQVEIGLTSHSAPIHDRFRAKVIDELKTRFPALSSITVEFSEHSRPASPKGQIGLTCKSVIAVGSGKGGVGKSTVATSLAIGLKRMGCRVGLLDADVYGPSVPQLTGASGQPAKVGDKISPVEVEGIPTMSIGYMVPSNEAVIWRGPMLHSAVTQFVRDTDWGDLDYLIIDMPPGTGDVALTLSQLVPATGAVVVCTPQKVALLDADKAISMFNKVNIPVLGVVENMSSFVCPDNGKSYDIFGKGGARRLAEQRQVPFLGEIPITIPIREHGDQGNSFANFDDPQIASYLNEMVTELVWQVAKNAEKPSQPDLPVLS